MNGIQPTWLSLSAIFREGYRGSAPHSSQSTRAWTEFSDVSVTTEIIGAPGELWGILAEERIGMLITASVSAQGEKKGSHAPPWMLGSPISEGLSENAAACDPRSAQRRTSAAASSGSH